MKRFHVIDDGAVIVRRKGRFSQCRLYRRGTDLYAGLGSAFVRLMANGGTSDPNVSWDEFDAPGRSTMPGRFQAPVLTEDR